MLNTIAHFFLNFSHVTIVLPLVIFGYVWINRRIFSHTICLIFSSMIINHALKITFQIPLSPALNKAGYAFPSGHMQFSTVLYGWLGSKFKHPAVRALVAIILSGIGYGLIHFGYHDLKDVIAAVFVAGVIIFVYTHFSKNGDRCAKHFALITIYACLAYIWFHQNGEIPSHNWMAAYGLTGFILSEELFQTNDSPSPIIAKVLETILIVGVSFGITKLFEHSTFKNAAIHVQQLKWFFIGFTLPFCTFMTHKLSSK